MNTQQLLKTLRDAGLSPGAFVSDPTREEACVSVRGGVSCLSGLDVPEPQYLYLSRGEVVFFWPKARVTGDCTGVCEPRREQS